MPPCLLDAGGVERHGSWNGGEANTSRMGLGIYEGYAHIEGDRVGR